VPLHIYAARPLYGRRCSFAPPLCHVAMVGDAPSSRVQAVAHCCSGCCAPAHESYTPSARSTPAHQEHEAPPTFVTASPVLSVRCFGRDSVVAPGKTSTGRAADRYHKSMVAWLVSRLTHFQRSNPRSYLRPQGGYVHAHPFSFSFRVQNTVLSFSFRKTCNQLLLFKNMRTPSSNTNTQQHHSLFS
jgi:hypothetical protein